MVVQSVIFPLTRFTEQTARAWLQANGYNPKGKMHITSNYLRFRQTEPIPGARYATFMADMRGVKLVTELNRDTDLWRRAA